MVTTDPIADMLTRIRNALTARHAEVLIPRSNVKCAIAKILLDEGYVKNVEEIGGNDYKGNIKIALKYGPNKDGVISGLKRVSRPGLRIYENSESLPVVRNGLGIAIISTNKGIMTDKQARAAKLGGEVMAFVW